MSLDVGIRILDCDVNHEPMTARLDHASSANIFQVDDLLFNLDL